MLWAAPRSEVHTDEVHLSARLFGPLQDSKPRQALVERVEPWRVPDVYFWQAQADRLLRAGWSDHWWTHTQNKKHIQVSRAECQRLKTPRRSYSSYYSFRRFPLQMNVHATIPKKFHDDIQLAIDTWNSAAGRELIQIKNWQRTEAFVQRTIMRANSWMRDSMNSRARRVLASMYHDGGNIAVNFSLSLKWMNLLRLRNYARDIAAPLLSRHEPIFYNMLLHELGHVLGLPHRRAEYGAITMTPYTTVGGLADYHAKRPLSLKEVKLARCLALIF